MTEPEKPDVLDVLISMMGTEARAKALHNRLAEAGYAIVSVSKEAIEKAAMVISAMFEGVPSGVIMHALAEEGVWVVGKPELRHDWVSLADNTLLATHPADRCNGRHCCIHNPSDHALKTAPMHWNDAIRRTERVCQHGQHHPDPDHLSYILDNEGMLEYFQHKHHRPCDGCCQLQVPDQFRLNH